MQKYQTAPESRGVYYYMDDYLHLKLLEKSMLSSKQINYLESFEHQIETSFFYPLFFAHLNILISILCGAKSEIAICVSLVVGFIIGTIFSLSANFVFYLLPINMIMTFYNFLNKYFVIDIAIFFAYIFVIKKWWIIFFHIGIFAVLCFLKGSLTAYARENFCNKLALKWLNDDTGNKENLDQYKPSKVKYDSKNNELFIKVVKKYILISCLTTIACYILLMVGEILKGNTELIFIADLLIELIVSLPLDFMVLLLPEILIRYKSIKKPTTKIIAFLISLAHYILYSIVFSFLLGEFTRCGLWWLLIQCKIMTEQQECSDTQEEYKEPYIYQNGKHFTEPAEELPIIHEQTIDTDISSDEARLAELSEELKKIPVAKVKQWHNEGKITDEQYKTVARKYNEIRKEMKEIKERAELAKSIEIEENNVKSEKNKTNHSKFKTLIICFSFIAAITGTSFLSVHLANISRIYSDEDYQKLQEKYTTLEINYNNQKRLLNTVSNNYKKLNENYLALLAENEKNDSQSVDSVESYLNNEIEEQTTNTIKTTSPIRTYVMSKIYGTDAYPGSFTIGSTKDEVKEAMGIAPDKIINYDYSGDVWYYYDSKITFDTSDRVNGWDIGETLLPVY